MSDCSTSTMKPKERRTCGTCKHVNDVRLGCMFAANDNSYYMRCTKPNAMACEHYVDDPDSPQRRYERLAQVAREMYGLIRFESYGGQAGYFRDKLEGCAVSVDD